MYTRVYTTRVCKYQGGFVSCQRIACYVQSLFLTTPARITCKQSLRAVPYIGPYAIIVWSILERTGSLTYLTAMASSLRVADGFLWEVFKTRLAGLWMLWAVHIFLLATVFALQRIAIRVCARETGKGSKKLKVADVDEGPFVLVPTAANKVVPTQLDQQATYPSDECNGADTKP
jgi:hypothetical protein